MPHDPTEFHSRAILLVAASSEVDADLVKALSDRATVHHVETVEDALEALRLRHYEIVVTKPNVLLSLASLSGPLRAATILESIGQGVCVVARDGQMLWSNRKLDSYPGHAVDAIRNVCARLCGEFAADRSKPDAPSSRRRDVEVDPEHSFELQASPVPRPDETVEQVVALVWDVTATRRLRNKLDAIDAAGRELVRLDVETLAEMDVGDRLPLLEDKVIRTMRDLLHSEHFIIRLLDRRSNRLDTVVAGGMPEDAQALDLYADAEGSGISGYVASRGEPYLCPDVTLDPRFLPGAENTCSSLTIPLRLHDQVVGVLNIESARADAFTEADRQLAEVFGRYIATALNILKLLAVERHTTTGQLASDMTAALATPLNDIVTEATNIMEDYIGQDDLRRRLHSIIDNVDRAKRALKAVTESPGLRGISDSAERDSVLDGKRILIADDEEIIRETVADVLSKTGALTVMAKDGEQAITLVRSQHFDLVLSDIKMPHKNGYEVFAAVKQVDPHCPVILITGLGYDPKHAIVRASKEGLAAVLYKPFKVAKLLEEIRHALTTHVI